MALISRERNIHRLALKIMRKKLASKLEAVLLAPSLHKKGKESINKVIVSFITGWNSFI